MCQRRTMAVSTRSYAATKEQLLLRLALEWSSVAGTAVMQALIG